MIIIIIIIGVAIIVIMSIRLDNNVLPSIIYWNYSRDSHFDDSKD